MPAAYDAMDRSLRELFQLPMPGDWRENLEYLKQFGTLRDIAGILGVQEARVRHWDGGDILPSIPSQSRIVDLVPRLISQRDIRDTLVVEYLYFYGTLSYSGGDYDYLPPRLPLKSRLGSVEAGRLAKAWREARAAPLQNAVEDLDMFNGGELQSGGHLNTDITFWWDVI